MECNKPAATADVPPAPLMSLSEDGEVKPVYTSQGVEAIAAERQRQIEVNGYTAAHDDDHAAGTLSDASVAYITGDLGHLPYGWTLKPAGMRRNLVKAGALIAAEIDRLDRWEAKVAKGKATADE